MKRWPLLFALCVLLLAPQSARAIDVPTSHHQVQPADFRAIDAYVAAQIRAMHIPGAALGIVRGTEIVHLQGYGVANPAGEPMTAQTPVILGSTSKSFTALAVMQLVEAGKLNLDAPVQDYLPWFRPGSAQGPTKEAADAAKITVRHLLSHTSGIPTGGIVGASIAIPSEQSMEDSVRSLEALPITAPAGDRYQYSNSNYVVLGALIETTSGQTYASYVRDHVFGPLRMQHSFASKGEARRYGMAAEHRWWFGLPISQDLPYPRATVPAGFLISSAQDIAQYLVAQLNDGRYLDQAVLSPSGIAHIHHPAVSMDPRGGSAYGMGWAVRESAGERSIFHSGETAGSHSDLIMLPAQRLGIVVLTNVNGNVGIATGAQGEIALGVQRLLLGQAPPAKSPFWPRYLAFDGVLLVGSALATWSLVRLLTRRRQRPRWRLVGVLTGVALPLLWEFGLPIWLLAGLPSLAQASWPLILLFFPDLGHWLHALCALLLMTGGVRLVMAFPGSANRPRGTYSFVSSGEGVTGPGVNSAPPRSSPSGIVLAAGGLWLAISPTQRRPQPPAGAAYSGRDSGWCSA